MAQEEAISLVYSSRLRRVSVTVQTWYAVLKSRAYRRARRQGEMDDWRPAPRSRGLPARWHALANAIQGRLPALEELRVEVWEHQPFMWRRDKGQDEQVGEAEG